MNLPLAFPIGPMEMMWIGLVAVVVFGARRLPELGRSLGKGIVEFKKGLKGIEDETDTTTVSKSEPAAELPRPPQRVTPPGVRFEETSADNSNAPH